VLQNIVTEIGVLVKLFWLRRVSNKSIFYTHCFSNLLWNMPSRKFKTMRMELNEKHQLLLYADDTYILGKM
jgi:hypothetical protein